MEKLQMTNLFRKALLASPVAVAATLAIAGGSFAAETAAPVSVDALSNSDNSVELAQVTSVSELSDVLPSDWAYTALQRLVEEYGCIEGYPDRTFRGNRAMTRYEFAAGLNACLDVIVQLIDTGDSSELDTIRRLQEEFAAELATIRGRVDTLEADVAELEANQFSTTTKLRGQLDSHLVIPFDAPTGADEVTFDYRARLNFDTSFTGEDRLRIRFQASDQIGAADGAGGLANASGIGIGEDNIRLDDVYYAFPVGERLSVTLAANSMNADDFVTSTIVPFDGPSVGDFGGPVFYDAYSTGDSFGVGVNFALTESLVLDLGYATDNGNDPGTGIFDEYEYIVQLNYLSDGLIDAAITYMDGEGVGGPDSVIAGLLNLDFGGFELGGYYASVDGAGFEDSWQIGAAFPSFLGTGNEFGVYGGEDLDGDFIAEGYYEVGVNEFLTITPAILYGDPNAGDSEFYGVVRTTFRF
jgi:Carbohydrate-selective porin, OprB family/S-layer homology domain